MALCTLLAGLAAQASAASPDGAWTVPLTSELQLPSTSIDPKHPRLSKSALGDPEIQKWLGRWTSGPAGTPWTEIALSLIEKYQQNPPRAARILAYLHVGIHDTQLHARQKTRNPQLRDIAVHSAASAILDYFYPQEPVGRFGALGLSATIATATNRSVKEEAVAGYWTLGQSIAAQVIERAKNDQADAVWSIRLRPPTAPGRWEASPPLNVYKPLEPLAGQWRTWALSGPSELTAAPPISYDTPEYWAEVEEVIQVTRNLTAEQKRIAESWNLGHGTVTPAGVWNRHALDHVQRTKFDTSKSAQLFAALNVAMMDAFIACWNVKFTHWTQRPVTAVRSKYDPDFLPHLVTPPFPSYISGHATVSGAASEVLSAFFPTQAETFRGMAEQAAMSRLYGGIHFRSDNEEGLELGLQIGRKVVDRLGRRY